MRGWGLDKQAVQCIADSAATWNMPAVLPTYREFRRISVVGYADLTVDICTDHGWVRVAVNEVAHAPLLHYNLTSLPSMALKGHTYTGDKDGVRVKLEEGETPTFSAGR